MVVRIVAAVLGAVLASTGAALIYPPVGLIVAGSMLLAFALYSDDGR